MPASCSTCADSAREHASPLRSRLDVASAVVRSGDRSSSEHAPFSSVPDDHEERHYVSRKQWKNKAKALP